MIYYVDIWTYPYLLKEEAHSLVGGIGSFSHPFLDSPNAT